MSKKFSFFGEKFPTTIAAFFEYAKGGRFNYTYTGNLNGDSSFQNNDLLYIPESSEVLQMQFEGPGQAEAFETYILQDDYLSENRGQYMDRYGALATWRGKWDVKILQDFNIQISEEKVNTIQLSVDILNFGNLINSDWGVVQQPNNLSPISISSIDANNVPTYKFDTNLTETFGYDSSLNSRWKAQIGLRYTF